MLNWPSGDKQSLVFYFFVGAVITVLFMQTLVWILSNYGAESILLDVRKDIARQVETLGNPTTNQLLTDEKIQSYTLFSSRLNVLMFMVTITVILTGFLLILRHWVFAPIDRILVKNRMDQDRRPEPIAEEHIPSNEIGLIIRSRNQLLSTMDEVFSEEAIETLIHAVEAKDPYTQGHSRRVGSFSALIGEEMGMASEACDQLRYSGTLHDIGKIGINDEILTKPDELTEEEYETIKEHPEQGAEIIQFNVLDDRILHGILYHHESFDGSGYPEGLEGEEIPLFGRILAVADAVDAMLSDREYREGLPLTIVREELQTNQGTQFDPDLAEIGLDLLRPANADRLPSLFEQAVRADENEA